MRSALEAMLVGVAVVAGAAGASPPAYAQDHVHPSDSAPPREAPEASSSEQHGDHPAAVGALFAPRDASGTAWLPVATPMSGVHQRAGRWELMIHGQAFAQFLFESGEVHRRSRQAGSINWIMGIARRPLGTGRVGVRGMISLEPWTVPGCGYPDLLATGETCEGDTIHDRQHPHDLFMELAVEYDRPLGRSLRWHAYGGATGEPALGPAGFPHRASAAANLLAPIGHHWLDATHITFGVITTGVSSDRWKAEASLFNGREPDENRADLDLAPLDSFAGRFTILPLDTVAVQVSGGRLEDAEGHGTLPRSDVTRVTASATYHRPIRDKAIWATTLGWGMNLEDEVIATGPIRIASHSLLFESAAALASRDVVFGRLEITGKPAHDLHVHESTAVFTVAKLQFGYTRYFAGRGPLQMGVGASVSASLVPPTLAPRYGGRILPGFGVFLTVRPAGHVM